MGRELVEEMRPESSRKDAFRQEKNSPERMHSTSYLEPAHLSFLIHFVCACMCSSVRSQKRVFDPLELEEQALWDTWLVICDLNSGPQLSGKLS